MAKSIQDYRNIVKILKLQLLKVRQQNSSLSHQLGIISQSENSCNFLFYFSNIIIAYTPKINRYKQSKRTFSQNILIFLQFAHRCQLVGITPEMIFRIADKQRDKQVNKKSIAQIIKRIKLRLNDQQIQKLTNLLSKGNKIFYQDYLQILSAFQINTQKYPIDSSRTFIQLSLIKFCEKNKIKYKNVVELYRKINGDQPYFQFHQFNNFCSKQNIELKDTQTISIFLGLDLQNQCKIQKNIFKRQIQKIYQLIDKGIIDDRTTKPKKRIQQKQNSNQRNQNNNNNNKQRRNEQLQIDSASQGDQKFVKKINKQQIKKQPKKQSKIDKSQNIKTIQQILIKGSLSVSQFINILIKNQRKDILIRSFSLNDLITAFQGKSVTKKDIIKVFQLLDKDGNGSVTTQEIIKLWIRADDIKKAKTQQIIYKLMYRHLKQIQFHQPLTKFINLGFKQTQNISTKNISQVFQKLQLTKQQIQFIANQIGSIPIQKFCELLKNQGKIDCGKKFSKMKSQDFLALSNSLKKLNQKSKNARFKKLIRLNDEQENIKQQDKYWNTIFSDEWACFQFCLNTAEKLQSFWRDPQFGPTLNDKHGIKSIVGNQSQIPPGLPDQEEIQWLIYQQILQRKKQTNVKVQFMKPDLLPTDVVQGRLGDCWYISALSIIANNDSYIKGKKIKENKSFDPEILVSGIHPPLFHFFINYGLYVFKFFKKFKPVYVIVDDLFPVQSSTNDLIFAKSPQLDHQWVSFAEKAYAKLHHAYSNMISGDIAQGLNDLTNALPIKQNLNKDNFNPQDLSNCQYLAKIKRLTEQRQLMGCSISAPKGTGVEKPVQLDDQRCGLFYGHAYSITDYLDLKTQDQNFSLMRIRNPWGHSQWILDWSDKPLNNDQNYKKIEKYQANIDKYYADKKKSNRGEQQALNSYRTGEDGQFLMNFKDWFSIFTNLFTGFSFKNKQYIGQFIIDKWDEKTPSGICKMKGASTKQEMQFVENNHQYILTVNEPTDILMLVIQQDGRLYRGQKYPYKQLVNAVIVLSFTLNGETSLKKFDKEKMTFKDNLKLQIRRDVDFWHRFEKGTYAIIPCKAKNQITQSQFQLRVYSDNKIKIQKKRKEGEKANNFQDLQQIKKKQVNNESMDKILNYLREKNPKYSYPGDKQK